MAGKNTSKGAALLDDIKKALRREMQYENALREIDDKIETLGRQKAAIEREKGNLAEIFEKDADMTAIAREMMEQALELQGKGSGGVKVYNPKYVTQKDKHALLIQVLEDWAAENKSSDGMPFTAIKDVLKNRYGIDTESTGMFFRNQLKEYETEGGSRNRKVMLKKAQKKAEAE